MQNPLHPESIVKDNHLERLPNDTTIRRLPVQQYINIGSLYDARTDSIIRNILLRQNAIIKPILFKTVYCEILKDDRIEAKNLLHEIGIDDDQWLSLALNMISIDEISPLVDLIFHINKKSRIFHYCYINDEKCVTDQLHKLRETIPVTMIDKDTTHIISGIRSGIHVVAILKVSVDNENEINHLLEKKCQDLTTETNFQISTSEKHLFSQLTLTNIFSNIKDLNETKTFFDLCQQIVRIKKLKTFHRPLQYILRSIQYIYPSYVKNAGKYVQLDQENMMTVKQYLFPLWFKMKQLKMFLNSEIEEVLKQYLKTQFYEVQQQIRKVQGEYSNIIKRIRYWIFEYRNGRIKVKLTSDMLIKTSELLLENKIDICIERLRTLREKAKFINDLNQQNIKYFNIEHIVIEENDDIKKILQIIIKPSKEEFVFCSTDQLREDDPSKWNEYCNKWIKNREINLSPRLTYVDFSYVTSFHLLQTQIFSLYPAADVKRTFAFPNLPISPAARSIQLLDKQLKQTRRRVTLPKLVHFSKTNPKSSELEAIVHIDNAQSTSQSSENLTSENVFKLNEQYNKTEIKHYELISSKNPILKKTTKEIRNSPTVSSLLSTRTHTFTLEKQADTTEQYTNVPGTYSNSTLTSMLQKKHKGENTKQRIDQTNSQKLSSIRYASKQKQAYLIQEQNYKSNSLPQLNSTNIPTNMLYHD
ncbi:unnamed protein product [Rotaria sp. Silwood1]|nr:unnamed protein product [Rotaria sp. Silwood1]